VTEEEAMGLAGARPPLTLDVDLTAPGAVGALHERLHELGFSDGLPVVAPTPDLVKTILLGR
jgi:hypothetical protein